MAVAVLVLEVNAVAEVDALRLLGSDRLADATLAKGKDPGSSVRPVLTHLL